jgi:hypothetical protein
MWVDDETSMRSTWVAGLVLLLVLAAVAVM